MKYVNPYPYPYPNPDQVKYVEGGLDACVRLADGDMRRVINVLQSTHMSADLVDEASVYKCTGSPLPQVALAVFSERGGVGRDLA